MVITDGWDPQEHYVGYDEDFVPTVDAWTHRQSIVPFYKASFVWLMQRQTTDYFLRVVVPLAFILVVAYMSIFIPQTHFEAIVTIQVTALLSSVALYLALPKIDADSTTLSDRIFLFCYMAVSLMIVISILRVNHSGLKHPLAQTRARTGPYHSYPTAGGRYGCLSASRQPRRYVIVRELYLSTTCEWGRPCPIERPLGNYP